MTWLERTRAWPRPLMMWGCLPLVPVAVIYPGVDAAKLAAFLAFAAALFGIRGYEKIRGVA